MFFHLWKYKILQLFHSKEIIIWMFLFPLLLGTLFYMGFGNMLKDDSDFDPIPVAVVETASSEKSGVPDAEQISSAILKEVIENLSKETEDQLFVATWTEAEKAERLLKQEKVDGILYISEEPKLTIKENGLNQSILNSFLSQFMGQSYAIQEIAGKDPQKLQKVVESLSNQEEYNHEISESGSNNTNLIQYFYALIAMVCLYGFIPGYMASISLQPHLSAVGSRKNMAPIHKMKMILADFTACVLVNYLSVLLVYLYLIWILKIDMGTKIPQALLASFVGSIIGVAIGMFNGSLGNWSKMLKESVCFAVSMLCCFLGGLMINTMPNIIEQYVPIINRINPAALLSDSFYSLTIYSGYERYGKNLIMLLVIAGILCLGSYLMLRRKTDR